MDCPVHWPGIGHCSGRYRCRPKGLPIGAEFLGLDWARSEQHSSGGARTGFAGSGKQGDRYLRGLFVAGALARYPLRQIHGTKHRPWLRALLARRPTKVAAIALANKIARMACAMMVKGERYKNLSPLSA